MAHLVATKQSQQLTWKDHYMVGKEEEGANAAMEKSAQGIGCSRCKIRRLILPIIYKYQSC
jgi:hypothetical protein